MGGLSIIAPTRNPTPLFLEEMAHLARAEPGWQIVIVDDHSTLPVSRHLPGLANLQIHRQSVKRGAGACRNWGIAQVHKPFSLFLDDDDSMDWQVVRAAIETMQAQPQIEFSFFLYDRLIDGEPAAALPRDRAILAEALGGRTWRRVNPSDHEALLAFTNYPWNKIYRTSFLQRSGIRFSETAVQNDILAHWLSLLQATVIALDGRVLCTKVDYSDGERISNISDRRCLEVFSALEQVYALVRRLSRPAVRQIFLAYSQDLLAWRLSRTDPCLQQAWQEQMRNLMRRMAEDGLLERQGPEAMGHEPLPAAPEAAVADSDTLLQAELSRLTRLCHQEREETERLQAERQQLLAEAAALRVQSDALSAELARLRQSRPSLRLRARIRRSLGPLARQLRRAAGLGSNGADG